MNPHVEAWRAKQDQLKGQTEGQVAGSTLVMMNSVCSQLKDEVLDIKRTADGINNTFVSVEDRLKSATEVIQQGAQKVAKNAQQMIQEVGNEVKISITDACKNLNDITPKIRQESEQIRQNIAPIGEHLFAFNQACDKLVSMNIEELISSIVRLNEQQKNNEEATLKRQKTASNWTKLLFTLLSVLGASVVGFAVVLVLFSAVDTKLFKENSELKKANSDLYKSYIEYKDQRNEAVAKYNELAEVAKWLAGGEDKLRAYIQQYRESKRK